jgi:sRNA-binding carbon storage regulator CsrA
MLIFTGKSHGSFVIGGPIDLEHSLKVTVLEIKNGSVKLGFEVSDGAPANRSEAWQRVRTNHVLGRGSKPR